ncbi:MAG: DUF6326 family protein [Candidatus Odinarchaeota archaeon]
MSLNQSKKNYGDMTINVKLKISALWVAVMFFYSYADVLGFYKPGNLNELLTGEIAGLEITPEFLFGSAILVAIPSLMGFFSLIMKAQVNRWVNIILAIIYSLVVIITLLMSGNWAYYIFYAIIELVIYSLIVWYAWQWPLQEH